MGDIRIGDSMKEIIKKDIQEQFDNIVENGKLHDIDEIGAFKLQLLYWKKFIERVIDDGDSKQELVCFVDGVYIRYCRMFIEL